MQAPTCRRNTMEYVEPIEARGNVGLPSIRDAAFSSHPSTHRHRRVTPQPIDDGEAPDDPPLVSVVIPTHDRPVELRGAVRSVLAQTYEPIEVLVVDDSSRVPAREVLAGMTGVEGRNGSREKGPRNAAPTVERVDVLRFEENRGGSAARNAGIEAANGSYVAFLDDDDRWDPAKLEQQVARIEAEPADVGLCYTGVVQLDADGRVNAVNPATAEGSLTRTLLTVNVVGTISSALVRREVVESVGGLDERFPSWQDWAFYVRVSESYRFCAIDEPLVVRHNAGDDQLSGDYWTKRDETAPLFRETFGPLAARYGRSFEQRFDAYVEYHLGLSAIRAGEFSAARGHFLAAMRRYPRAPIFACYLGAVAGGRLTYVPLYRLGSYVPIRAVKRALQ